MTPTRRWTITVAVEDHDDGTAFTEAMMAAHGDVARRLDADGVDTYDVTLTDTHGTVILGNDPATAHA